MRRTRWISAGSKFDMNAMASKGAASSPALPLGASDGASSPALALGSASDMVLCSQVQKNENDKQRRTYRTTVRTGKSCAGLLADTPIESPPPLPIPTAPSPIITTTAQP